MNLILKKVNTIALLSLLIFQLTSCSGMRKFRRNDRRTYRLFHSLAKKQGNAFYINSTYANYSKVWYYTGERMVVYKIINARIRTKNEYPSRTQLITSFSEEADYEVFNCSELDGGGFGFKIVLDGETLIEEEYPTNIDCLKKGGFQTKFLNDIANDISTYKMW